MGAIEIFSGKKDKIIEYCTTRQEELLEAHNLAEFYGSQAIVRMSNERTFYPAVLDWIERNGASKLEHTLRDDPFKIHGFPSPELREDLLSFITTGKSLFYSVFDLPAFAQTKTRKMLEEVAQVGIETEERKRRLSEETLAAKIAVERKEKLSELGLTEKDIQRIKGI